MNEIEKMIENPSKKTIIKFLDGIKKEYITISLSDRDKYIQELKEFMLYILFSTTQYQKEKLGESANSFMICVKDYWLIICWYIVMSCKEPFLDNIDEIINIVKDEWIDTDCFNLDEDVMANLMDIAEEKFNLLSILENSESNFYYFNIPFKNKYAECNTHPITNFAYVFELYGVDMEAFPLQISFGYLLGLSLYFYILEKKPKLITDFKKEFNIKDNDCSSQFGDYFALALLQFTDYDIEELDLKTKEKYTRYFESLTSSLCVEKDFSGNDLCPCGSGKKYKDCCMKKDMKWITKNGNLKKQFKMNDIVSDSFKEFIKDFKKVFGRDAYRKERLFSTISITDSNYANMFSKMADLDLPLNYQYAALKTGMLLSEHNYNQFSDLDLDEWDEAIDEFENLNEAKKYNGKSIFEYVRETNLKLNKLDKNISSVEYVMNSYINTLPLNYNFSKHAINNQKDFSIVCARKIVIDTNILLTAFNHKSVEEATNITRIIFEDLIQTEILLKNEDLFKEKIVPLTLLEKGTLQYKLNPNGQIAKNKLVNPVTNEEFNVKINIKDFSLKSANYKKLYDDIFDGLSSFIHLNVNKIPRYFNIPNPLMEVQEYKIVCLLGLFLLNQCIYEIKSNIHLDRLLLRDMEYVYNNNYKYINKCLKALLVLDASNEIYKYIIDVQKKCIKTINPNNKIKLNS